jgi:hypothetical protein
MTTFQIMLLVAVSLFLLLSVAVLIQGRVDRRASAAWTLLWLVGFLAVLQPNATTKIAQAVGISRGKDLLLYCSVLFMLVGFFMIYIRLRRLRRQLTLLVRQIAINEAEAGARPGVSGGPADG